MGINLTTYGSCPIEIVPHPRLYSQDQEYGAPQTLASCLVSPFLVCFRFHVFSVLLLFICTHYFEGFI